MMTKKKPQRMCVSCRTKRDKKDLLRVVLQADGSVVYDPTGKMSGRGSYLCRNEDCIKAELKAHRLAKGLRHMVSEEELSSVAASVLKEIDDTNGDE